MNRKTVYMIVGLIVVALAALGVGYGLWFEDLKVHGDVTTGELDVDFTNLFVEEKFKEGVCNNDGSGGLPICAEKLESVNCVAALSQNAMGAQVGDAETSTDNDYLGVTVTGAYPSYTCHVNFRITNNGTVPVHLYSWYEAPDNGFPKPALECRYDYDGDGDLDWQSVSIQDPGFLMIGDAPAQLHTGDWIHCRTDVHFTNEDNLAENATYRFQYHFRACQWNENGACDDFEDYPFEPPATQ